MIRLVYFLRAGRGAVKIGLSKNVDARITELQNGNAGRLRVLRTIEGTARTENLAHKAFAQHHIRGEWFRYTPEMLTWTEPMVTAPKLKQPRRHGADVAPGPETELLTKIMSFLKATGEAETHFGRRVMNDPMFLNRLRHGRRLYAETVAKIEAAMEGKRESRDSRKSQAAGAMRSAKRGRNGRGSTKGQNADNR
jgi:hypothetical protein